jgi:hypothetical protein
MSCASILRWSARADVDAARLRRALGDVRSIDAMTPPTSDSLKAEFIDTTVTIEQYIRSSGAQRAVSTLTGEAERSRRLAKLVYANWLSQCDVPSHRRSAQEPGEYSLFTIPPELERDPKLVPPARIQQWGRSGGILRNFAPAIEGFLTAVGREQARQRALELALALQIYHREHGRFPESLDALAGEFFETIPADPFGKGEPMRYRLLFTPDSGALLWSVGEDGVDQGGIEPERRRLEPGDMVFRIRAPVGEKGSSGG